MAAPAEIELQLLKDYLTAAIEAKTPGDATRTLALYEKQVALCKAAGYDFNVEWCEAMAYYIRANNKLNEEGILEKGLRETARQSSGFDGLAPAMLAKTREEGRIREAIAMVSSAIKLYSDDPDFWMLRAALNDAVNNKQAALQDVTYILTNFSGDQQAYMAARKLKDEIETKQNSKDCFIATAVYEDIDAPQLIVLRAYRDNVLQATRMGRALVRFYYAVSPNVARLLSRSSQAKRMIRQTILDPIVARLDDRR